MERLLRDAERMAGYIEGSLDIESFADIADAIHIVQEEMGITGTTALEAGRTISGSVGAMKSAWTNLVTGFADGSADIGGLIDNLVTTIVGDGTENNLGVIGNVLPAIETALGGIAKLIEGAAPKIIEILPGLVEKIVPSLISAATGMVNSVVSVLPSLLKTVISALTSNASTLVSAGMELVSQLLDGVIAEIPNIFKAGLWIVEDIIDGITEATPKLVETVPEMIEEMVSMFGDLLPEIVTCATTLVESLVSGIAMNLPKIIQSASDLVMTIASSLTDPWVLSQLLNSAITIIQELAYGLMDAIPQLVQAAFLIIENLVTFLLNPANLAKLLKMAFDIIVGIGTGLINAIPELLKSVTRIITGIIAMFKDADWGKIGKDLVDGFKRGISSAWNSLKTWFKNLFGDLIGIAKKILGIASPSKVFKKIGGFTAEGFGAGFEDEFAHVKDDMEDALNFDDASVGINASIRKVGAGAAGGAFGGTSIGNININIDGAKYSDEQSLASAIALEIQNMTDRRAAVYA